MVGAFWVYHLWLSDYLTRTGLALGALRERHVVPLIAVPDLSVSLWLVPALVVVAAFVGLGLRLYLAPHVPARALLPFSCAAFLAIGWAVAMIDGYRPLPFNQSAPAPLVTYARESEFYEDVPTLRREGLTGFLAKYGKPAFFERLALHSKTHPAGPVVFLWAVRRSIGQGLLGATLATVLFGSLAVWPVFWIGRMLHGEAAARLALALYLLMPNVVLFSTTSMDAPFATMTILALALFLKATRSGPRWTIAFGLALAAASFLTYASVFVPIFATVYAVLAARADRTRARRLLGVLGGGALTVIACYALLYLATGYDAIAAVRDAIGFDHTQMAGAGGGLRLYLNESVAHLAAFLFASGAPLAVLWARHTHRTVTQALHARAPDLFALAFVVSLVVMAFSTLFTLEVERIWLFMAPCVALAAACALEALPEPQRRATFYWAAALLATQTLIAETTLRTMW